MNCHRNFSRQVPYCWRSWTSCSWLHIQNSGSTVLFYIWAVTLQVFHYFNFVISFWLNISALKELSLLKSIYMCHKTANLFWFSPNAYNNYVISPFFFLLLFQVHDLFVFHCYFCCCVWTRTMPIDMLMWTEESSGGLNSRP